MVGPVAAVLVRLNVAAPATPTPVADTVYDPAVAPAANVGAVATPSTPDVALADTLPPLKVPVAPLAGAVNVTLTPATGWPPESVTFPARLVAKGVLTVALCGGPATAATAAGGVVGAAVSTPSWGALAPDSRLPYLFWFDDPALLSKL